MSPSTLSNLIGKHFGKLVVTKKIKGTRGKWIAKCECGQQREVIGSVLTSGRLKSCGSILCDDLTGKVFGKLTVMGPFKGKKGRWWLKCVCGKKFHRIASEIKKGKQKSCGRINCRNRITDEKRALNFIMVDLRKSKWDVKISDDLIWNISISDCGYCGARPIERPGMYSGRVLKGVNRIKTNGIDRIDSKKGYVVGNVIACCEQCNRMKLDYSLAFFKHHLTRIMLYQKSKTSPVR